MGDVGIGRVLEVLVPNKQARGFIWILVALGTVAAGGAIGYTALVRNDVKRIDRRVWPIKVKVYEDAAINRHVFDHFEDQLPPAQRHNVDDIKREAHKELIEDEKVQKSSEGDSE